MRQLSPKQLEALDVVVDRRYLPSLVREVDGWHARWIVPGGVSDSTVSGWVDEFVRTSASTPMSADAEDHEHRTLHDAWINALRSRSGLIRWDDAECGEFARSLAEWRRECRFDAKSRKGLHFVFDAGTSTVSCDAVRGLASHVALGLSVRCFSPLGGLRRTDSGRLSVVLSQSEAELFLSEGVRRLADAGYSVSGDVAHAEITFSAVVGGGGMDASVRGDRLSLAVKVAGQAVTAEEIRFLLEQNSAMVFFRNRWIEVDRNVLRMALRVLEKYDSRKLSKIEAISFACGVGRIDGVELNEIASRGWVRGLLNDMRRVRDSKAIAVPRTFCGKLRDYQKRGVAWLGFMTANGFGALLADDMGLGKTIQTIAWILASRQSLSRGVNQPTLVVAPLTLLSNWTHELSRFAPSLRVYVHQGHCRHAGTGFIRVATEADVVLTSYNLLVKDHLRFGEISWHALVLDEAQAIKNPDTAVARAVLALTPPRRIALTGTPVENSVSDIWSIEAFLNPGFLGDRRDFSRRFEKPLTDNPQSAAGLRLRHALEPFVLRRLKSDPDIAAELGPKREIREFCTLTSGGRAEYEAALSLYRETEGTRGDVFALLTRLKLVCDGEGKFERLVEILEQVFAAGEKALVFTQYAKVGIDLKRKLEKRFGREFPFLYGALSTGARQDEINAFRSAAEPTAFVLSLRTGGYGLNLTEATHVIHYDRWWNPAVENQATDRAHRIGQDKTVFVHLMITAGTVEEHVDEILAQKRMLSGGLVTSGEAFLSKLPAEVFERTVSLDE